MHRNSSTPPPLAHAISGSLGSALALLLLYPLERVRTELQSNAASSPSQQQQEGEDTSEVRGPSDSPRSQLSTSTNESWVSCVGDDGGGGGDNPPLLTPEIVETNDGIESTKLPARPRREAPAINSVIPQSTTPPPHRHPRQQSQVGESLLSCLLRLHAEGNLYSGVGPVVTTLATSNFVFFLAHQVMKRILLANHGTSQTKNKHISRALLASTLAGMLNVVVTNPLWVANLRIMVQSKPGDTNDGEGQRRNLLSEMTSIVRQEGFSSLWKGTTTSMLLVSNPVIQFFFYEQLKQLLLQAKRRRSQRAQQLAPLEAFGLGAIAKAVATVLTYPLQLAQVLLRLQAQQQDSNSDQAGTSRPHQYKGTLDCLWQLSMAPTSSNPIAPLFTGMQAKLLQTCLTAAVTFWSYEQILRVVHQAILMR
jgi:adenine nucleotide transporter 17